LEKLDEADIAGRKTGVMFTPGTKIDPNAPIPGEDKPLPDNGTKTTEPTTTEPTEKLIVIKPPEPKNTPPKAEPKAPEGEKRKGKKGDG
ncbi:MAG TPA: hypothetical protein VL501_05795, partial [Pyrinomonadaceae bacterium]|nr:hypothetical protein [Pyrinomonadaceae bacterium]